MNTMPHLSEIFIDPDIIGESEYRILYELLDDVLHDMASDEETYSPDQQADQLLAVLNEVVNSAESMKRRLRVWKQKNR